MLPQTEVRNGDVTIAVHELAGHAPLPPLLISHATGFHAHAYEPVARVLSRSFHVWALDHRGHGDTALPAGSEVDWVASGTDTVAAARAIGGGDGVVGFGHSMGGATLLLAAHRDPTLFRRLVLFEPIAFPPAPAGAGTDDPLADGALRRRATFESFDAAYERYASRPPLGSFDRAALRRYVDHGFRPVGDGVTLKCSPAVEAATFRASTTSGVWDLLDEIAVPVTVIAGGDGHPPAVAAAAIAARLSDAALVEREDLDHFGPFVDPVAVGNLVAEALTAAG